MNNTRYGKVSKGDEFKRRISPFPRYLKLPAYLLPYPTQKSSKGQLQTEIHFLVITQSAFRLACLLYPIL